MQETSMQGAQQRPMLSIAEGFFRHWRLFGVICAGVLIVVAALTFGSQKRYRSETKFLLENNRGNAVITADRSNTSSAVEITEQQINSEIEVLGSDDVVSAVADPGWKALPESERTSSAMKAHEVSLHKFRKYLSIEPARRATVIIVSYSAPSAAEATGVLERFSNAYLAQRKLLARPIGTSSFFAEEASRYQEAWKQANRDLTVFQQQHHLVSLQQAEDTLSKQIAAYEDDLREEQANISEMTTRYRVGLHAVAEVPERQSTQQHTISNQSSIDQMRTMLVQLQNRRTELLTRYTPQERLVQEVTRQIEETRASLNEALTQKSREDTTDINPAWQQVQSGLVEQSIERQAMLSKASATSRALAGLQARLGELQALDVAFNALQEKTDQARSNFELFSEKRDQAQIEDAMDEHKLINVAVAESPTSTFVPVSPKPILNLTLGFLTALFLATASVYLAESARTTFGSARELEGVSRYGVLATVPYALQTWEVENRQADRQRVSERRFGGSPELNIAPAMQNLANSTDL